MIIFAAFVLGISGCDLISKTPAGVKKTAVATVNGEKITKDDYSKRLSAQEQQYEAQVGADFFTKNPQYLSQVKSQVLQQMIQQTVMLQKAAELKLTVDDKTVNTEVDKQIASTIKNFGGQKTYEAQLKAAKLTPQSYRATLVEEYKTNLTLHKLYDKITASAKVVDQEVINYYYTNQYKYTVKPDTMNVSHILLTTEANAQKAYKDLKAGMKFADAVKKYSTDTATKGKGGLLGDILYTDTTHDNYFMGTAIATKPGQISAPVKSQDGYHIIRINSRHEYKLKPMASVKAEITKTLLDSKKTTLFNTAYASWEKAAKIVQHPELL